LILKSLNNPAIFLRSAPVIEAHFLARSMPLRLWKTGAREPGSAPFR